MRFNPDNTTEKRAAYKEKLEAMSDAELFREAKDKIWFSAFANNNPISCFHWQADATSDEAARRKKSKIYDDAYRTTVTGCGYSDPQPNDGPCGEWAGESVVDPTSGGAE